MTDDMQHKLAAMQAGYKEKLPTKMTDIDQLWQQLKHDFNKQTLADFYRSVHSLHGSAGTFGFAQVSDAAGALEACLTELQKKGLNELPAEYEIAIVGHMMALKAVIDKR